MTITERIFGILAQKGLSQKEFSKIIDVNEKTVSAWKKNNSLPPVDKISKISDCLGVSIQYLITGEDSATEESLSNDEIQLLTYYRKLNDKSQGMILGEAKALASSDDE
ncbi:MAG: helix-turn-helix transcriptional regulator [Ruminococcus sp.]|nr:helix-turn-helix transcriptional regulator [Ruminococcus sp.]MBR1863842.1 helix-turn-helix transcriptional regulator [Ruminococcus sp.]